MKLFKKTSPPETGKPETEPLPSGVGEAERLIGGLGWYRLQYQRAMKLAVGLVLVLLACAAVIGLLIIKDMS